MDKLMSFLNQPLPSIADIVLACGSVTVAFTAICLFLRIIISLPRIVLSSKKKSG